MGSGSLLLWSSHGKIRDDCMNKLDHSINNNCLNNRRVDADLLAYEGENGAKYFAAKYLVK
jgi:hypothetical protein